VPIAPVPAVLFFAGVFFAKRGVLERKKATNYETGGGNYKKVARPDGNRHEYRQAT
jgi:hypothetical protein